MEQARLDAIEQVYPERIKQIEKMIMAGVKFVTGTDSGFGEVSFNRISKEMALFVEAGMGRMEAILTATRYAAEALGLSELVGTLEPGKEADIAVFKGEPHRNIDNINKVVAVFHAGERIV
jgi:imidazolonepropionase-like amidohydrolase